MTSNELQKLLSSDLKFDVRAIQEFINEMKYDVIKVMYDYPRNPSEKFYQGEINAFQICLDLLEHCESEVTEND